MAGKDICVFLFDYTGTMAKPWLDAGYECWILDIQHETNFGLPWPAESSVTSEGRLRRVNHDLSRPWLPPFDRNRVAFSFAFPPCDHLSVAGARWFKGKGLRRLAWSIDMFATSVEMLEWLGAPYGIENPNSNIASHWRSSDYSFSPWEFTQLCADDNYTKWTHIWAGHGFVMPETCPIPSVDAAVKVAMLKYRRRDRFRIPARDKVLEEMAGDPNFELLQKWYPDNRIHDARPGPDRANFRSATPMGFARAAAAANMPSAPSLQIAA